MPATYVQATPDLMMGDLLKNMRSSQIFSVCGLPEIEISRSRISPTKTGRPRTRSNCSASTCSTRRRWRPEHRRGDDVPAWFLDTDYNGLCFHVSQAFFPRTGAWDNLKKALEGHVRGQRLGPPGRHGQRAVRGRRARADRREGDRRPRE